MTVRVRLNAIEKRYGPVVANDGVSCEADAGEIHAILGENGAGKTTLMRILAGLERPDSGAIEIDGKATTFRNPKDAMRAGIGMVHQHLSLIPALTVAENLALGSQDYSGRNPTAWVRIVRERANALGFDIRAEAPVWQLSMGERQRVEVFRLLFHGARILVLDEPTSILSPLEAEQLFSQLRQFASRGNTVFLVTHKVKHAKAVADRVTVLRRGRSVATADIHGVSESELAELMVGKSGVFQNGARIPRSEVAGGVLLRLENVGVKSIACPSGVNDVSLQVREGDVLGIAGVSSSGQDEIVAAITGTAPHSGTITWSQPDAPRAFIPSDRTGVGVALSLSVKDNLSLRNYGRTEFRSGPILNTKRLGDAARELIAQYAIQTDTPDAPIATLSGGNIQKVILARELSREPQMIIAENPTAGLDLATTILIQKELSKHAARGAGVILVSEDLDELLALCDRIIVMHDGHVAGTFAVSEDELPRIAAAMTGITIPHGARQMETSENRSAARATSGAHVVSR
ncbi:MAG: ral nucleoside transport system ATP-binding protein [Acidobacteriota bacterium]|jgi:simple sugar transport system ATP-binding protein|nr:ral nucleoside transport system ATP-binding protein [Acidobacteriota bacterium]